MTGSGKSKLEDVAVQYFRLVDAGDPAVIDLFVDDAQMFYPKFGHARGKAEIGAFARGLARGVSRLQHELDDFNVIAVGSYVVVEGAEHGRTSSGIDFPDGTSSFGVFCNVFEFEGDLIKQVHIYVDPDFASTHADGVAWGESVQADIAELRRADKT
ncbi:nuclear transport factor 2 family protein [Modestobacter versicolor]|uniref:Nuclear transport factor 2 family protein n=1 Tax=Modestobacter versicolor TaxID=429133 RepID=A0A323VAX0_9ACTN|nr:nuclear transport factor 2 family protein [Modestobacter versicolor]PZA21310.1 nuclear transport factor 2 family protein [Modestobacter versicolor]